jgi:hypothetical protein
MQALHAAMHGAAYQFPLTSHVQTSVVVSNSPPLHIIINNGAWCIGAAYLTQSVTVNVSNVRGPLTGARGVLEAGACDV